MRKDLVQIRFGAGVDAKTDSKLIEPPVLGVLENGMLDKTGTVRKRNGQIAVTTSGAPSVGHSLIAAGPQLVQLGTNDLYYYSDKNVLWSKAAALDGTDIAPTKPIEVSERRVTRSLPSTSYSDMVVVNGVEVHAIPYNTGSALKVYTKVVDAATGNIVTPEFAQGTTFSTGDWVRLVACGSSAWLVYRTAANTIKGFRLDTTSVPYSWSAGTTLCTDANATNPPVEVCTGFNSTTWHVAYFDNASTTTLREFSEAGVQQRTTTVATSCAHTLAVYQWPDTTDKQVYLLTAATGTATINYTLLSSTYGAVFGPGALFSSIASTWRGVTLVRTSTAGEVLAAASDSPDATHYGSLTWRTITKLAAAGTQYRQYQLRNKCKAYYHNSEAYLVAEYLGSNTLQPVVLVLARYTNSTTQALGAVARLWQDSSYDGSEQQLSNTTVVASKVYSSRMIRLPSATLQIYTGVDSCVIDHAPKPVPSVYLGNGASLFGGGVVKLWDGAASYENTPHWAPETPTLTNLGSGTTPAAGTYNYKVTYEWEDSTGRIHRSAPSPVATLTTGGATNIKVEINGLTTTTLDGSSLKSIRYVVYRTISNGTIYYQTTSGVGSAATLAGGVSFTDSTQDSTLQQQGVLYTEGGVVDNSAPPPMHSLLLANGRVFGISSQRRNEVWYTKYLTSGTAPEWSDQFVLYLDEDAQGVALGRIDDKVIVLTADAIYAVVGDGPLDTGQQNTFGTPTKINTLTGCTDRTSVVSGPFGLVFRGRNGGMYLLDRGLELTYIGGPVENNNTYATNSAVMVPELQQVRWTLDSTSQAIVWDFRQNQWSIYTNHTSVHAGSWNGVYTRLTSGGQAIYESSGTYLDPSSTAITLAIATAWIKLHGLAGYQRVSKARLLGTLTGASPALKVSLGYNYQNLYTTTYSWSAADMDFYNPLPDILAQYDLEIVPNVQKCQAIRVRIEDNSASNNATWGLAEIELELGIKQGVGKVASTYRKAGA